MLERELARGGMARVLLATLRGAGGFEKKLVVKQIRDELAFDQEFIRRFVEEAKTTVALSHPNIVPVYELGVVEGTYFLAMELVEGVSVAELLEGENGGRERLSPEEGAYIGAEICRALDYAHRRMQVVHRDITPRNVMVDEEGQVKLIDFGIAARAKALKHEVFGSPGHMPPEQMEGKPLGPPTDLFAVAVLMMEAWSGRAPFRRKTPEGCEEALRAPHPVASTIDIRLLPIDPQITSAMALDPADRPQQADDLGRALRKFLHGIDLGDVARGLGERVRRAREKAHDSAQERRDSGSGPMAALDPELVTKTFAARQEMQKWSDPPPALSEGTRKIPLSEAPVKIETVATRPLETPAKIPVTTKVPARNVRGWAMAALGVGAIAAASVAFSKSPPAPSANAPAIAPAPPPPASTPSAASSTAPATSAIPSAVASASSPSSATPVRAAGHFALYGDPGTEVSIDGVARGKCPVRDVEVEPGTHDVRFDFDATGESHGERIPITAGARVTVRADFTGATPTLRIQR
ncbi:MAG: serine/threonine-protein kinase [Polyangiaceae bacterium]